VREDADISLFSDAVQLSPEGHIIAFFYAIRIWPTDSQYPVHLEKNCENIMNLSL